MNSKNILFTLILILLILAGCSNSKIEETLIEEETPIIVEDKSGEELYEIMIEDIDTKLLEGYEKSSIQEIKDMIDFEIVEPDYLPEKFKNYGIFMKDNPGMPELKMVNQLWYDVEEREIFMVTQMEGAPKDNSDGEIVFISNLESGGNINDIYPWANNSGRYEFIKDGVLVQGYVLLNKDDIEEAEKILKSLK